MLLIIVGLIAMSLAKKTCDGEFKKINCFSNVTKMKIRKKMRNNLIVNLFIYSLMRNKNESIVAFDLLLTLINGIECILKKKLIIII